MDIFNGNSEPYFPPQFRYVGFVLVITGCIMVITANYFGIGFIIIGPTFFLLKTGIRINFKEQSFQEFRGIQGLYFGKWEKLPEIEYVTVYMETESQTLNTHSIISESTDSYYNTDLIFPEPNRLQVISFPDKSDAMKAGKLLSQKLHTRLLDYTSTEPVWMDNENESDEKIAEIT
ncbi:MAG: hypothetical protein ACOYMF_02725 [Bacteroidales bacterium]